MKIIYFKGYPYMKLSVGSVIELKEFENRKFLITKKNEGGFGIVYFLKSLSNFKNCVLKVFKGKVTLEDIKRESFAWAQISSHQNIASYITYGVIDEKPYILSLKYNATLESLLSKEISIQEIKEIFEGVVAGLHYSYQKIHLIHKDIKPNNIFLDGLTPKIGDFGLSSFEKFKFDMNVQPKSFCKFSEYVDTPWGGTLPFMAPELFQENAEFSIKTDLFALGVTFFIIFTKGLLPYDQKLHLIHQASFDAFHKNCTDIKFAELILKCIDLDPAVRPMDYSQLLQHPAFALEKQDDGLPDVINTIQLLRRTSQTTQALEYAKDELKKYPLHPLLINQIAILYKIQNDLKTFEFVLSVFFETNQSLNYSTELYFDPLFTLANYYISIDDSSKFIHYIKLYDSELKQNSKWANQYPEYGMYLALVGEKEDAYVILEKALQNHTLPEKYVLFICCFFFSIGKQKEFVSALSTKSGKFESGLFNLVRIDIEYELFVNECRKEFKEFIDVLF